MKLIRRMYADGKSTKEIGKAVGISGATVWTWLKEDGVEIRKSGARRQYDPDELRKLADEGRTIADIAEQMDASASAVGKWMQEHDIKINLEARAARRQAKKKAEKASPEKEKKPEPVKKCKTCIYRSGSSVYGCNYIGNEGHSRMLICPIIGCTVYKRGKRLKSS